jgi:hypothetical protein
MSKTLARNWSHICNVPCPATRLALAACKEPGTLKRLANEFSECFSEAGDTSRVPFSAIQRKECELLLMLPFYTLSEARAIARYEWADAARFFNIPVVGQWNVTEGDAIPQEIVAQLRGRRMEVPMVVNYTGTPCVVVDAYWQEDVDGSRIPDDWEFEKLTLSPADCVDFDA